MREFNLDEKLNQIIELFEKKFDEKFIYDEIKEKQIDKLHSELQRYKQDIVFKTMKPLVHGIIYMYDDLDKMIQKYKNSSDELSPEKMLKFLDSLREDIEILLEENGINSFKEELNTKFNPKRQQLVKKVPTEDKEKVGEVVESIRVGFETATDLIKKERVAVYVYEDKTKEKLEKLLTELKNLQQGEK